MNCIILLLLLGCCGGWGNDCGCGNEGRSGNNCGCRNEGRSGNNCGCGNEGRSGNDCGCGNEGRGRNDGRGGCASDSDCRNSRELGRRDSDRRDGGTRGPEMDGGRCNDDCCQENQNGRSGNDCGCAREERESCDIPGMIPPPWQEYPRFPRRDNGEDCEG